MIYRPRAERSGISMLIYVDRGIIFNFTLASTTLREVFFQEKKIALFSRMGGEPQG